LLLLEFLFFRYVGITEVGRTGDLLLYYLDLIAAAAGRSRIVYHLATTPLGQRFYQRMPLLRS